MFSNIKKLISLKWNLLEKKRNNVSVDLNTLIKIFTIKEIQE